jgi:LysM repeat protein
MYHLVSLAAKTALVAATSLSGHTSAAPSYTAPSYTVQPGDTLGSIAARSGTTWEAVYAANRTVIGGDPNVIGTGEQLALSAAGDARNGLRSAVGDGDNDGDDAGQGASEAPAQAPSASPQQPTSSAYGTASGAGGIPASYFSCVRFRESTNGQGSGDQFGITPSSWSAYGFSGSPYTAPYSEQVAAFQRIYAAVGTSAWSPYDGC